MNFKIDFVCTYKIELKHLIFLIKHSINNVFEDSFIFLLMFLKICGFPITCDF